MLYKYFFIDSKHLTKKPLQKVLNKKNEKDTFKALKECVKRG